MRRPSLHTSARPTMKNPHAAGRHQPQPIATAMGRVFRGFKAPAQRSRIGATRSRLAVPDRSSWDVSIRVSKGGQPFFRRRCRAYKAASGGREPAWSYIKAVPLHSDSFHPASASQYRLRKGIWRSIDLLGPKRRHISESREPCRRVPTSRPNSPAAKSPIIFASANGHSGVTCSYARISGLFARDGICCSRNPTSRLWRRHAGNAP